MGDRARRLGGMPHGFFKGRAPTGRGLPPAANEGTDGTAGDATRPESCVSSTGGGNQPESGEGRVR